MNEFKIFRSILEFIWVVIWITLAVFYFYELLIYFNLYDGEQFYITTIILMGIYALIINTVLALVISVIDIRNKLFDDER